MVVVTVLLLKQRMFQGKNKYIQSAILNGQKLNTFYFQASELLRGGKLILVMGDQPNHLWGI